MKSNWEVAEIIKRARMAMNIKNDSEFAKFLGISRATVSNWYTRRSIDFPLLLSKMEGVDYNWLLTGKGNSPYNANPIYCETEGAEGMVQIVHNPKTSESKNDRHIPLYNLSAAANLKSLLSDKHQFVMGKIEIPNAPQCDGAIYVSGDSMYPILKSGDIICFKELSNFNNLIYGEIYLVSFSLDDDEYLAVKYINHSSREGYVKLVSYNEHHQPMDIPVGCINALGLVKLSVRRHTMM